MSLTTSTLTLPLPFILTSIISACVFQIVDWIRQLIHPSHCLGTSLHAFLFATFMHILSCCITHLKSPPMVQ
ncbi:hypothetical protein BDQ17DRAFT_1430418 [Cyathus striatus]|nr:hypothetical protein BDQ17DRAFT_1430418 [Cyathus striatus]